MAPAHKGSGSHKEREPQGEGATRRGASIERRGGQCLKVRCCGRPRVMTRRNIKIGEKMQ